MVIPSFLMRQAACLPSLSRPLSFTGMQRLRLCRCQQESGNGDAPPTPLYPSAGFRWAKIGIALSSLGFFIGPVLDGIHSNAQLLIYDKGAVNIGPLQTNVVVPPLLGIFYGVVGLLQLALDIRFGTKIRPRKASLKQLILSFTFLVVILELSSEMYKAGIPYNIEAYTLFALAELNWYLFDGSWWGFGLAAFVGVICPLAEIPLMKYFGLWHYPKANITVFDEGLVTWVLACYFSYVPFLANLSRWLDLQFGSQRRNALK